jgi:hypothetical protein
LSSHLAISSPKRDSRTQRDWESFFPYYAGYSESFASAILASAKLNPAAIVLDPWNGSGTTTFAASQLGIKSCGLDLNPAMVIVARSRLLSPSEADSLIPLARKLLSGAKFEREVSESDPLTIWFGPRTAAHIRAVERQIRAHLVGEHSLRSDGVRLDQISGIASTFYVALFSVCRALASRYLSSNPTCLRYPKSGERKAKSSMAYIHKSMLESISAMSSALLMNRRHGDPSRAPSNTMAADSTSYRFKANSIDFILTSPPYCTRIDYTAATRIELAVLDPLLKGEPEELRRSMLGSTLAPKHRIEVASDWGGGSYCFSRRVALSSIKGIARLLLSYSYRLLR